MTSIESVVKEMEAEMENHFSESKTTVNEYNKGLHSGIYSYIGSLLPKLKSISPQGASEGISKIREVMNWISQCVDEDHDLEVSEIKMIWNDLSDAISLIESTPHSSEGMAEAVKFAKFLADNDYRPGSGNKHWFKWNGMEVDETPLTLEQVYQIFASLSPGVEDNQTKKQ